MDTNKGLISWFARNSVAANLLMAIILVAGVASVFTIKKQMFPEIVLEQVNIRVPYLGAAPQEVESGVIDKIEESLRGVNGIKRIRSTAVEGLATVRAEIANNYNKDVFAFPGKVTDTKSEGCNYLIQSNKAVLIRNGEDVIEQMGWEEKQKKKTIQKQLFVDLSSDEKMIVQLLEKQEQMSIDEINLQSTINSSAVAAALLMMEMNGIVKSLPGKIYKLS